MLVRLRGDLVLVAGKDCGGARKGCDVGTDRGADMGFGVEMGCCGTDMSCGADMSCDAGMGCGGAEVGRDVAAMGCLVTVAGIG